MIGFWNPVSEPEELVVNREKTLEWLSKGAQPTESVLKILKRTEVWSEFLKQRGGK
jgi:small subunit ribosomal protein S16